MEAIKTSAELRSLASSLDRGIIHSTHYVGCWRSHVSCALKHAANVIDALEAFILDENLGEALKNKAFEDL